MPIHRTERGWKSTLSAHPGLSEWKSRPTEVRPNRESRPFRIRPPLPTNRGLNLFPPYAACVPSTHHGSGSSRSFPGHELWAQHHRRCADTLRNAGRLRHLRRLQEGYRAEQSFWQPISPSPNVRIDASPDFLQLGVLLQRGVLNEIDSRDASPDMLPAPFRGNPARG
jgi:hypothetical protein